MARLAAGDLAEHSLIKHDLVEAESVQDGLPGHAPAYTLTKEADLPTIRPSEAASFDHNLTGDA